MWLVVLSLTIHIVYHHVSIHYQYNKRHTGKIAALKKKKKKKNNNNNNNVQDLVEDYEWKQKRLTRKNELTADEYWVIITKALIDIEKYLSYYEKHLIDYSFPTLDYNLVEKNGIRLSNDYDDSLVKTWQDIISV